MTTTTISYDLKDSNCESIMIDVAFQSSQLKDEKLEEKQQDYVLHDISKGVKPEVSIAKEFLNKSLLLKVLPLFKQSVSFNFSYYKIP